MSDDLAPLPSIPLGRYRHYKGGEYEVLGVVRHSETLEPLVLYRPLYNDSGCWVRPFAMFVETIEHEGRRQPRFGRVELEGKLTLYTNPQSRGRIAHWMLEELGEPFDTVWLDYGTTMKAADYRAINPMGKVPALRHGTAVVTEAAAICAYLADAFPHKNLLPQTPAERATYFRWLFFAAGPVEQAVVARTLGWTVPEGQGTMVGFGSYGDVLDTLELGLRDTAYVCGARFTAADVYVGSSVIWGLQFGTLEKRPAFEAYAQRLTARPAYVRSVQINESRLVGH